MFEKLSRVEERYNKIAADLCDPAVVADISRYTALMKEQKHLTLSLIHISEPTRRS